MLLYWVIGGLTALLLAAIFIAIAALRRGASTLSVDRQASTANKSTQAPDQPAQVETPHVQRTKFAMGDAASPWTQGVYEKNTPNAKIDELLPAFAFDGNGDIHRTQDLDLVQHLDIAGLSHECTTVAGLAVHGPLAVLALWHAGKSEYKLMALKVASNVQVAETERDLIRFLFQDLLEQRIAANKVRGIEHWSEPKFSAAVKVYLSAALTPGEWQELEKILPDEFKDLYELEAAQKLPPKILYRRAATSKVFADGLLRLSMKVTERYLNPRRWQRMLQAGNIDRVRAWSKSLPCENEQQALLIVTNPEIFDKEDFSAEQVQKIVPLLEATDPGNWLFHHGQKPELKLRRQYFKFFCLFARYNEAVCCFSTLGTFRRERANRLFYARALFQCGMPHESWAEISALLTDFPRDAAVLNEAGIYAHKMGRHEDAAEIFGLARSLYPEDATIAYNEAIFTEHYSKVQIEQKWTAVQKMQEPPVVG